MENKEKQICHAKTSLFLGFVSLSAMIVLTLIHIFTAVPMLPKLIEDSNIYDAVTIGIFAIFAVGCVFSIRLSIREALNKPIPNRIALTGLMLSLIAIFIGVLQIIMYAIAFILVIILALTGPITV